MKGKNGGSPEPFELGKGADIGGKIPSKGIAGKQEREAWGEGEENCAFAGEGRRGALAAGNIIKSWKSV